MTIQHAPNLPFPHSFKTLNDAEGYAKRLRAAISEWAATLPMHVDNETLGLTTLSDPGADRIVFWDDSADKLAWLAVGTSLSLSGTTLDAIQDIRTVAGPSFDHLHLTVATGTAPLGITSTTMSPNLNADLLDGYHASDLTASSGSMAKSVAQSTHGLSAGDVVKCTAANTYAKAQADSSANAEVAGVVSDVTDVDNFTLLMGGYWASASVPAQAAGTVMFLSPTVAGGMTATEPTTDGQISKPLGIVVENAAKMLVFNMRGVQLSTPAGAVWTNIGSNPQTGEYRIKDIRLDADLKVVILYDNTPEPAPADYPTITSTPGSGQYRIKALRLDSSLKIVVVYDGTPEP